MRAQYAWKPLLSFEQFSAGNYTVGRGYDPGVLLGDEGFGTQAEIRFGSRIRRQRDANPRSKAMPSGIMRRSTIVDPAHRRQRPSASEFVGAGARISFRPLSLDSALAVPLTRIGIDNKRPPVRFLVSLTSRLWPWSYR